tara:strand:- start:313 stop:501 length:189 start_codon:yes stop_codon:yes gene_type:complete
MYIDPSPVAQPVLIPIRQAIREERMKIEDAAFDRDETVNPWYLNFLLSEQDRGLTEIFSHWE